MACPNADVESDVKADKTVIVKSTLTRDALPGSTVMADIK
jgi:hypothetical protein